MIFTDREKYILSLVLELRPGRNRRLNPELLSLSFYSPELKGRKQIAGLLDGVKRKQELAKSDISRQRYFNTLSNQGLLQGTSIDPKLTPLSDNYQRAFDTPHEEDYWRSRESELIETNVIRGLCEIMRAGGEISDAFKNAWFNAQTFFDSIPAADMVVVLESYDRLLAMFHINSVGWEIARYYRLTIAERNEFDEAFAKVPKCGRWVPQSDIEKAAEAYKMAADAIQPDVRFRISAFLNAYNVLRQELNAALPRLDRRLVLREGTVAGVSPTRADAAPLEHPRQLIVSGCPGSGKSHFLEASLSKAVCQTIRTQFHSESSYYEFFGVYKPKPVYRLQAGDDLEELDGSRATRGRPMIDYRFVPGPLMQAIVRAHMDPSCNVVLIIEEINRGNAAAVFGDMLQLLDRAEDGTSRYGVSVTSEVEDHLAQYNVSMPSLRFPGNLYIWGTMNAADQGVFPLDTAFRRRWDFIYKGFREPCLYQDAFVFYGGVSHEWDLFRGVLNDALILLGVHEDKLIGPYFLTRSEIFQPSSVRDKLLLYLWDDALRFRTEGIFTAGSFSEVSASWKDGAGAPLNITFPTATSTIVAGSPSPLPASGAAAPVSQV